MSKTCFTAFYPSKPFWAVTPVNFQVQRVEGWFNNQMAEVVYSNETAKYVLEVCRDGEISIRIPDLERNEPTGAPFPIEDTVERWGQYLDYLNAFYLLLDSATIEIDNLAYFNLHEITLRDAFRIAYEDGKRSGYNVASESICSVWQMRRYSSSYPPGLPIECDPTIVMRHVVSVNAISDADSKLEQAVALGAVKPLAAFAKSLAEYKVGNYDTCLVLAWFIVEAAVTTLWSTHLDRLNTDLPGGSRRLNTDRMRFLTGRDLPVSVLSNMLELFGVVDHRLFDDIDSVRRCRNEIVHPRRQFSIGYLEAQRALRTAVSMIEILWHISVKPSFGYSVVGL